MNQLRTPYILSIEYRSARSILSKRAIHKDLIILPFGKVSYFDVQITCNTTIIYITAETNAIILLCNKQIQ